MADPFTPAQRSAFMSRVGSKHTRPELVVRRLLHSQGYRFRLHEKSLPGQPDIVFTKRKTAVFVHGCFWHMHTGCKGSRVPKTRAAYWRTKLEGNRERDRLHEKKLRGMGW